MPELEWREPKWISISSLMDFVRCPRRYFYRKILGLAEVEEHPALTFGSGIHAGIGWLFGHPDDFEGALAAFKREWKDRDLLGDSKRNSDMATKVLLAWMSRHNPGQSLYEPVKPPQALLNTSAPVEVHSDYEVPFAVDLGLGIPLVGRIDCFVRHRDTKALRVLELKTSSEASQRVLDGFRLSGQILTYAVAARAGGVDVSGGFVEVLPVQKTTNDPLLAVIDTPDHLLDDTVKWLKWSISSLLYMWEHRDFPKDWSGCNPYFSFGMPGYNCNFERLCAVPDYSLLAGTFRIEDEKPFVLATIAGKEPANA